jgi:hypothetical protein
MGFADFVEENGVKENEENGVRREKRNEFLHLSMVLGRAEEE